MTQPDTKNKRLAALLHLADQDVKAVHLLAREDNHYAAYHCQQAAEKLIRVLLIHLDIEPGLEHRLELLIAKMPDDNPWKNKVRWMDKYTPYATTYRYPTPGGRIPRTPDASDVMADADTIGSLILTAKHDLIDAASQ